MLNGQWHPVAVTVDSDNSGNMFIDGEEVDFYAVDLIYVPEPSTRVLLVLGLVVGLYRRRNHTYRELSPSL